jgi:hypothetical protein
MAYGAICVEECVYDRYPRLASREVACTGSADGRRLCGTGFSQHLDMARAGGRKGRESRLGTRTDGDPTGGMIDA